MTSERKMPMPKMWEGIRVEPQCELLLDRPDVRRGYAECRRPGKGFVTARPMRKDGSGWGWTWKPFTYCVDHGHALVVSLELEGFEVDYRNRPAPAAAASEARRGLPGSEAC